MAQLDFDPRGIDAEKPFEDLPPGDYVGCITSSQIVENSKKTGYVMKLQGQVLDGERKGAVFFDNVNIRNESSACEQIGKARLAAICQACRLSDKIVRDSCELHNIPMIVKIGLRRGDPTRTEVKGYQPYVAQTKERSGGIVTNAHPVTEEKAKPVWAR